VRLHLSLPCSSISGSIFKIAISSVIYSFELSFEFRLLRWLSTVPSNLSRYSRHQLAWVFSFENSLVFGGDFGTAA
jgi:hypothetical protein